jgi:hypothetical protein
MCGKLHTSNGSEMGGEENNNIVQRPRVRGRERCVSLVTRRDLVIWRNCLVGVNPECLSRLSFAYVQERGIMHKPS